MGKESPATETKDRKKTLYRRDINKGYMILYLAVILVIVLGGVLLYFLEGGFSLVELIQNIVGNLMGVFGAFLVFDIAHEKLSKDSYAGEVSEQILDTLMYHPEAMELYENEQKKKFVNAFIQSIVEDSDASEMIVSYLDNYLLTAEDFEKEEKKITEKDCRIRTEFSYRFVLDAKRSSAFSDLCAPIDPEKNRDPYFYVQEELNYKTKYLSEKGNNLNQNELTIGYIYDSAGLDRFLRGNEHGKNNSLLTNCIFRESLDIDEADRKMFEECGEDKEKLIVLVKKMFRPHLNIDRFKGVVTDVEVIRDVGLFVKFSVGHDTGALEHSVDIVFHMPKKWDTLVEVVLVEPTKEPMISISYEEDEMDVEMYSFLNKSEASSYDNTYESENGVYSISLTGEWVFPISGVVFPVKRKAGTD